MGLATGRAKHKKNQATCMTLEEDIIAKGFDFEPVYDTGRYERFDSGNNKKNFFCYADSFDFQGNQIVTAHYGAGDLA